MKTPTCYLCCKPIARGDESKDHVPPKQFCAKDIREKFKPGIQLQTLPAHKACNAAYKADEEYFVASLGLLAVKTTAGKPLLDDLIARGRHVSGAALSRKVMAEFARSMPSGVVIPGMVIKHYDPDRVARVVWKIVRGLYALEYGEYLPEDADHDVQNATEDRDHPILKAVGSLPQHGKHPGLFAYKFGRDAHWSAWGMLFWDRLIFTAYAHEPKCPGCSHCNPVAASA